METGILAKVVCPSAEELSVIVKSVRCLECGLVFQNEPRLRMHDLKVHKRRNLDKSVKENVHYHCPVSSCIYALKSERYFSSMKYLKQVHKRGNLDKSVKENVHYHCPVSSCVYALKSQRYFSTMKFLKQHYLKVHAAKTFMCTQCSKSFSTEAAKEAHIRVCGVQFTCSCLKNFSTYEALLTHAKRCAHTVDNKYKLLLKGTQSKTPPAVHVTVVKLDKPIAILPNQIGSDATTGYTYNVAGKLKVTCDAAIQTDELKRTKKVPSPSKVNSGKRRVSQQTQTGVLQKDKHQRRSAETQTSDNYILKKAAQDAIASTPKARKRKKSNSPKKLEPAMLKEDLSFAENFEAQNLFSNSPLPLRHDVGLQDLWEEKNTSGTQTSPEKNLLEALNDNVTQTDFDMFYNEPTLMHCGSQTTRLNSLGYIEENSVNTFSFASSDSMNHSDPMLTEEMFDNKFSSIETQTELAFSQEFFDQDTSFTLSTNIETQTTESFENMDQLLYSNTCTQTSDEILLSDLGFSNIHTQTAWTQLGDSTVSTETQTKISRCNPSYSINGCKSWLHAQTSHMETQTDLLNIFEELN